jgi:hypothetical protein
MLGGRSPTTFDLAALGSGAHGVFLYGTSRTVLLRVAYALARANDPHPYWVAVRDPDDRLDAPGPLELGWIPDDHLFVLSRTEAKPQDAVSNLALWTVVRSDEPDSVIADLTDFLRLPPAVQEALSRYGQENYRPVFVVANTDRVRDYYPTTEAGVRAIVESMLHSGVIPIFTAVGPPGPGRMAFDCVFEVVAPDLQHWREGHLLCERSFEGAPFRSQQKVPLTSVPLIVAALEGKMDLPAASG